MREQLAGIHACVGGRERQRLIAFLALVQRDDSATPRLTRCGRELDVAAKSTFDFVENSHQQECSTSVSRMRSEVWPSQSGGEARAFFAEPFRVALAAATIFAVSVPTTMFVPISTVIGRSVFSRSVRHGMPRAVVSS